MSKQRTIRRTLLAMALAAMGVSGTAMAEPWFGDDFGTAEPLLGLAAGATSVSGRINNDWGTDFDYYWFDLKVGDVVTIQAATPSESELDTAMYVYDPAATRKFEAQTLQDTNPPRPGSVRTTDASVRFTADAEGSWRVAVTTDPANLGGLTGGLYTLFVTRVAAPEKPKKMKVKIDIRPGDPHDPSPINKAKGQVRVALLSSTQPGYEFDPYTIDVGSLRFGRAGDERSLIRCEKRGKDLNGDGKRDRVCRFDVWKTRFTRTDTLGVMNGTYGKNSNEFEGTGNVKVLTQKHVKHHWHKDDDNDD